VLFASAMSSAETRHVGILLFDGVEELDFVGPWEVFGASNAIIVEKAAETATAAAEEAADNTRRTGALPQEGEVRQQTRYVALTVAASCDAPVVCAKGLRVLPDHDFTSHPPLDILVVPGGQGTRRLVHDASAISWIARVARGAQWVVSVCTGALLLHKAGPARGKRVATHWAFEDTLQALGDVSVVRDKRFVVDGNIVTSQGVSAGIDMSLWLVGQLYSPEHARAVQRKIQYEPQPPYQLPP
jgi:transcriptional regulator GlxA family with amidase domain